MKKAHMKALEALFAYEVESALTGQRPPLQSRAKAYRELESEGLVKKVCRQMGYPVVTFIGWELTIAGHFIYCMTCSSDELEAA